MRDTLVIAIILAALVVGFSKFREQGWIGQQSKLSFAKSPKAASRGKVLHERRLINPKGDSDERTNRKFDLALENSRTSEGSSGDDSEVEKLTSIYPKSSPTRPSEGRVVRDEEKQKQPAQQVVPVEAFVQSHQTKLAYMPEVTGDIPAGLKVYLWCLEVKEKKLQYSGAHACDRLLETAAMVKASQATSMSPIEAIPR